MTNIIDGMDEARFKAGQTYKNKDQSKGKNKDEKMPTVLKNLNNGS